MPFTLFLYIVSKLKSQYQLNQIQSQSIIQQLKPDPTIKSVSNQFTHQHQSINQMQLTHLPTYSCYMNCLTDFKLTYPTIQSNYHQIKRQISNKTIIHQYLSSQQHQPSIIPLQNQPTPQSKLQRHYDLSSSTGKLQRKFQQSANRQKHCTDQKNKDFNISVITQYLTDISQTFQCFQKQQTTEGTLQRLNKLRRLLQIVHKFTVQETKSELPLFSEAIHNHRFLSIREANLRAGYRQLSQQNSQLIESFIEQDHSNLRNDNIQDIQNKLNTDQNKNLQSDKISKRKPLGEISRNFENEPINDFHDCNSETKTKIIMGSHQNQKNTHSTIHSPVIFYPPITPCTIDHRKNFNKPMNQKNHHQTLNKRDYATQFEDDHPNQTTKQLNTDKVNKNEIINVENEKDRNEQLLQQLMGLSVKSLNLSIHTLNLKSIQQSAYFTNSQQCNKQAKITNRTDIKKSFNKQKSCVSQSNCCKNHFSKDKLSFACLSDSRKSSNHESLSKVQRVSVKKEKGQIESREQLYGRLRKIKKEIKHLGLNDGDKQNTNQFNGAKPQSSVKRKLFSEQDRKRVQMNNDVIKQRVSKLQEAYKQIKSVYRNYEKSFVHDINSDK